MSGTPSNTSMWELEIIVRIVVFRVKHCAKVREGRLGCVLPSQYIIIHWRSDGVGLLSHGDGNDYAQRKAMTVPSTVASKVILGNNQDGNVILGSGCQHSFFGEPK